jgi:hypothetical protein
MPPAGKTCGIAEYGLEDYLVLVVMEAHISNIRVCYMREATLR